MIDTVQLYVKKLSSKKLIRCNESSMSGYRIIWQFAHRLEKEPHDIPRAYLFQPSIPDGMNHFLHVFSADERRSFLRVMNMLMIDAGVKVIAWPWIANLTTASYLEYIQMGKTACQNTSKEALFIFNKSMTLSESFSEIAALAGQYVILGLSDVAKELQVQVLTPPPLKVS